MNNKQMIDAGYVSKHMSFSDKEIIDQIKALRLTISYLNARGDAGIVVSKLMMEHNTFMGYSSSRKLKIVEW